MSSDVASDTGPKARIMSTRTNCEAPGPRVSRVIRDHHQDVRMSGSHSKSQINVNEFLSPILTRNDYFQFQVHYNFFS